MAVGFCRMIYHDCIQNPIVLPIYVRGIVWVFLSNFLSVNTTTTTPPDSHHNKRGVSNAHAI